MRIKTRQKSCVWHKIKVIRPHVEQFLCSMKETNPVEELAIVRETSAPLLPRNIDLYTMMEMWLWWTNARASIYFVVAPSAARIKVFRFAPGRLRPFSRSFYPLVFLRPCATPGAAGGRCWQLFWALNRIGGKVLARVSGSRRLPVFAGNPARRRSYESRTCVNTVVGCHLPLGRGWGSLSSRNDPGTGARKIARQPRVGDNTCPICGRRCGAIFHSQTQDQRVQASLRTRVRDDQEFSFAESKVFV